MTIYAMRGVETLHISCHQFISLFGIQTKSIQY